MAFVDMYSELSGSVPKLDIDFSKTLINRAYADVRRKNLWSFQLFEANWVSPAIVNGGTVTTVTGSNTITFDATASALIAPLAILGPFPTPLAQRQFRMGVGTIYNIWGIDVSTPTAVVLTLDRPYAEPSGSDQTYQIYQCYYPAPYIDAYCWINVRDMVNYNDLNIWGTRNDIDIKDPQRMLFYIPTDVVFYQNDHNPASQTYRFPLWEMWGQPSYVLTYQLAGIRKGLPLVNDADELPEALGEDVIMELGKVKAYEWAEANKGDMPRNAGSDYRFLIGNAKAEYKRLWSEYRLKDRELVDNWFSIRRHHRWLSNADGFYNSIGNTANPGAPW